MATDGRVRLFDREGCSLKRTLLVGMLLTLAVIGGAVEKGPITILSPRVIPLNVPDDNRDRPFTHADVHLLGDGAPPEIVNRELTYACGTGLVVHVNPVTGMTWFDTQPSVRRRAVVEEGLIIVGTDAGGTMEIRRGWDRKAYTFVEWSDKKEPENMGTCRLLP